MPQYAFGSGTLFGVRTDVTNPTPVQFGALQDVSIDFQFNMKELYGQYQFPLTVARSTAKVTGKAKFARVSGRAFNDLFFGQTLATGQQATALNEAAAIPTTPFQVTVANAAAYVADQGVAYAATGIPLVRVGSAPALGQYSVNVATGVYTFAAADTGLQVLLSYAYTVSASGQKFTIANQLLGAAPQFQVVLNEVYQGKQMNVQLNACISSKLSLPTKVEDFVVPEIDFSAFADAAGNIGLISLAEAS